MDELIDTNEELQSENNTLKDKLNTLSESECKPYESRGSLRSSRNSTATPNAI